jgi:hypothetical protein
MDAPSGSTSADAGDAVVLRSGCQPRYARVVRTVTASCASLESFSVERIGDVRLLADEVFNAVAALGATTVMFRLRPADGVLGMDVEADRRADVAPPADVLRIVRMVSDVIAPGAELTFDDHRVRFVAAIAGGPD